MIKVKILRGYCSNRDWIWLPYKIPFKNGVAEIADGEWIPDYERQLRNFTRSPVEIDKSNYSPKPINPIKKKAPNLPFEVIEISVESFEAPKKGKSKNE